MGGRGTAWTSPAQTMKQGDAVDLGGVTWGAARLENREPLQLEQTFRTTCPEATVDKTNQPWAMPYEKQAMYTFHYKEAEDAAKANPIKLPASKQKFTTHATFSITRHPKSGTSKLKETVGPPPQINVSDNLAAADSWLDGTEPKPT